MKTSSIIFFLLHLGLTQVIGQYSESSKHYKVESKALDEVYLKFSKAYQDLDSTAFKHIYADNAYYLDSDKVPIGHGRKYIDSFFGGFINWVRSNGNQMDIISHIISRQIYDCGVAIDIGYYKVPVTGPKPANYTGKFVNVFAKQPDGSWKFIVDSYSASPLEEFDKAKDMR